jgi:hypothetical protein
VGLRRRTLAAHIIDRARGGKDTQPNPLPIDQAIVIAEKVALSLATTAEMRDSAGNRFSHGALLPQFIWISDDGEIRVAGQQLAGGIIESLVDPKVAADIGRYFAPEIRTPGQKPKSADVYAMGAILFLLVTGHEPPDAMTASAFVAAVRAAKTMAGAPIPDDIRIILDKSFNLDPSMRYASLSDMKQAISALAHGGKYSATTFNLAFYLSNLLKKEMESEAAERDKESKLNLAPYLEQPKAAPAAPPTPTPAPAMFLAAEEAAREEEEQAAPHRRRRRRPRPPRRRRLVRPRPHLREARAGADGIRRPTATQPPRVISSRSWSAAGRHRRHPRPPPPAPRRTRKRRRKHSKTR